MGLSEHLRVIWRRKWRVFGVAVVLAAVVYGRSASRPDTYRAEALLVVTPGRTVAAESARLAARTYAALATTRPVVARAVADGSLSVGASTALERIDSEVSGGGTFVTLRAEGRSPRAAEQLASALAEALSRTVTDRQASARDERLKPLDDELADLERRLSSRDLPPDAPVRAALTAKYSEIARALVNARAAPLDRVELVSPARASTLPVAPTPAQDALAVFAAGLVAFSLVAVGVEALSDRFSTERATEEVSRVTGLPVLAEIPRAGGAEIVEAFRTLRTSLMFMATAERLRTLAVVSVDPASGKTFVALNLAREAAALEVPVVVIDGDLRRPVVHERLGVPRSPGLSEALSGSEEGSSAGKVVGGWMRVIPSGSPVPDPAALFGGRSFRDALDSMTWAELVVVDTPPAGLFADALAIASQCDATLIVVDAQGSRRRPVRHLVENLRQVSAQPIGVVLNRTEPLARSSYYDQRPAGRSRTPSRPAARSAGAPAPPDASIPGDDVPAVAPEQERS